MMLFSKKVKRFYQTQKTMRVLLSLLIAAALCCDFRYKKKIEECTGKVRKLVDFPIYQLRYFPRNKGFVQ